jgi:2-octaprenyl-6-methoxyphenol hydroxylase
MTQAFDFDIIIAGGGMVGASLALLLSHHTEDQLNILVAESFAAPQQYQLDKPIFRPSFDARSTALSYGSRLVLEPLGLWPQLAEHASSINSVHVCERGRLGSVLMTCDETAWPALGYVIENAWLGNVLLAALRNKSNIHYYSPASVNAICPQKNGVVVDLVCDGQPVSRLSTQLAVVADGAASELRQHLGIIAKTHQYKQTAVIANVSFSKQHNGRAYERFTEQGPMALLPLDDSEQAQARAALIWTMPDHQAQALSCSKDEHFLRELQQRFGHRQGQFTKVGERATYPLALVQAQEQVRSGIVVMGNAAHSLHPVAGQGFNLSLRDCSRLTSMTASNLRAGKSLGNLSSLNQYLSQQQFDQQKTAGFSDYLPSLFNHRLWGVGLARGLGLTALDVLPGAKNHFLRHAAGLHDGAAVSHRAS